MTYRKRINYTAAQRAEMWERWQKGETLHSIARLFDRHHTSVRGILAATGGIRPRERSRSRHALTLAEREQISRGMVAGQSIRWIAGSLGRAPSTVSREIQRNGGPRCYRASRADQAAWDRAQRPKPCELVIHRRLARLVAQKLRALWSPQQIAGWLKYTYPDDENHQVSHESIYKSLFIQARGALKKSCFSIFEASVRSGAPGMPASKVKDLARSQTPSPSVSDRRLLRIEPCPVTGKAICLSAPTTARLPRSWSAIRAM